MLVDFSLHDGGHCLHVERAVSKTGRWKNVQFPSMFGVIKHPKHGYILYDTGYSERFYEVTQKYPTKLYAQVTKVILKEEDVATAKLARMGIDPKDINYIIISHFHADHYGAIEDFPNAKFIYFKSSYEKVRHRKGLHALLDAFIPNLIPKNFEERSIVLEEKLQIQPINSILDQYFYSVDIFQDGSIYAIHLPGHAKGQMGLFLRTENGEKFLVADAAWQKSNYIDLAFPVPLAYIFMDNKKQYKQTLRHIQSIHQLNTMEIIPSHCGECFKKHVKDSKFSVKRLNGVYN